ncbi:MAG: type II toxin-antitoxin system MqsR family toxin [Deltaproteobacteria bacterium]|nr:type II toxin-antitoxin system MqsR family toxin [Deltaproteobacteria bacterium]
MALKPAHPLDEVKRLVNAYLQEGKDTVFISAPSRSVDQVMMIYPHFGVEQEAVTFILNGILTLTESDFCFSNLQWNDPNLVADVYGIIYDGKPWFIKFLIENDCLEEISFHPPEKPLRTVSGKTIPGVKR